MLAAAHWLQLLIDIKCMLMSGDEGGVRFISHVMSDNNNNVSDICDSICEKGPFGGKSRF